MTLRLRAAAYQPNGARLGVLPTPQDLQGSMVLGDVGAFSIAYPLDGPKSPWLAGACEVALEVSYDDGQTWTEPNDARYLRLRRRGDQVDAPNVVSYEGPSYLWLLEKAKVLPEGQLNTEGQRPFLSKTVGNIIRTLVLEAQARDELPGLDVSTFSGATDSNGTAWATVVTIYYDPGMDYLTILRNLSAQGLVDFTMAGRSLRLYKGGTVMAGPSGARLVKGRDLTEAPYTGTLEGLASHAFLLGDGGLTYERTNPSAPTPWGRWTAFISQGGVSDQGTMTVLTDATLALASEERVENTYGLDFDRAKSLPFRDYALGETIAVATGAEEPVDLRLRQITLTRDHLGKVGGNVILNDRFLEAEVSQARRITGITGGSTVDGGTGGRPDQRGDRSTPKAPAGLTSGSTAYLDDAGKAWALVTLDWADVTQNTDDTAITDLAYYEAFWRFASGGEWTSMGTSTTSTLARGGFQASTAYDFHVVAVDNASPAHRSAMSNVITDITANDATAPGKPSTPTAVAYLGQGLLGWDGLLDSGGSPPTDFDRAEFHLSTASGFAPSGATRVDATTSRAGGSTVVTGLTYGTPYYVKVVLYDRAGNASPASNQATFTPVKMGGIDLDAGVVGYDALAFKQSGNQVPDGTFEDATYRADLTAAGMTPGWAFQNVAANATSGRWSLVLSGATGPGTQRNVRLLGSRGVTIPGVAAPLTGMRVSPGEKWLTRFQAKGTTNGGLGVFWSVYGADGAFLSFLLSGALVQGAAFGTLSVVHTMPASAAYAIPYLEAKTSITTGTTYVDDVEVRPIIGTLLVDDAAITNAKIADLAVDKLTAGALSAAVTVSGRIATSLTGARVELNSTGLKAYDAGGVLTVDIPVTGGATFGGTVRTGTTGSRVEVKPGVSGGIIEIYSGYVTETAPGTISTVVTGDAPASNASVYLVSPKRNTYAQCTLQLQSADSDGAASAALYMSNGDLQIYGQANGAGSAFGGGIYLRNYGGGGSVWGSISRYGSGVRFGSTNGYAIVSSTSRVWMIGDTEVFAQAPSIQLSGAVEHLGGALKLSDTYVRTATFAANLGIASSPQGVIYRLTSSARYKVEIQDQDVALDSVRALRPRSYVDRTQWEDNGNDSTGLRRYLGLIAEEVAEIPGLGDLLVPRDDEGRPEAVDYDRVAVALIPWLHALEARLDALEASA